MGTSYLGAAMAGLGAGGTVLSQTMLAEQERQQRREEQLRVQRELQDQRQQDRIEMAQLTGRTGGGSRGSKGGGVMDLGSGQGEELMAAQMGMSVPEYRKFVEMERTGSDKGYRTEFTTLDDEQGEVKGSALPPGFEDFKAKKRAERAKLMETYSFSDDIDKIAKARGTDVETDLLEKAGSGDRKAGEGILYTKGKDPRETEAKAGEAAAKAKLATDKGELADRTDPNIRKTGGGGGGRSAVPEDAKNLRALVGSLERDVRSQRTIVSNAAGSKRAAEESKLAQLEADLQRARSGLSKAESTTTSPAPAPAAPAAAAKPDANSLRQKAMAAIAAGKSRSAVAAKFKELTGENL